MLVVARRQGGKLRSSAGLRVVEAGGLGEEGSSPKLCHQEGDAVGPRRSQGYVGRSFRRNAGDYIPVCKSFLDLWNPHEMNHWVSCTTTVISTECYVTAWEAALQILNTCVKKSWTSLSLMGRSNSCYVSTWKEALDIMYLHKNKS